MKTAVATTFAVAMLAASSFAFAADNKGGKDNNKNDQDRMTTGSILDGRTVAEPEDRQKCRDGLSGGALCQEDGTTMPQ